LAVQHSIRIIGGTWRGRKLPVIAEEGLRPTPDRVRETLFNWLAPYMVSAKCLDLFAGTGILSFEALSRGAASVTALERNKKAVQAIEKTQIALDALGMQCIHTDALRWLDTPPPDWDFDIIFLDPPYQSNWLAPCLKRLYNIIPNTKECLIYFEHNTAQHPFEPSQYEIYKSQKAGQIYYYLLKIVR